MDMQSEICILLCLIFATNNYFEWSWNIMEKNNFVGILRVA